MTLHATPEQLSVAGPAGRAVAAASAKSYFKAMTTTIAADSNTAIAAVRTPNPSHSLELHDRTIATGGFAKAAVYLSVSSLCVRLLALLSTSMVARILVPSDYGIVSLATIYIGLLDVLTNIQASSSLIRATSISDDQLRSAFTINAIRGLASGLILFAGSGLLARLAGDIRIGEVLRVLAIAPVLTGLQNPAFVLYERKLQFMPEITRTLAATGLGTVVCIMAALQFHSYWALVLNVLVVTSVLLVMTYWRVPKVIGISFKHAREFFNFGGWLVLVSIVEYLNAKVDVLIIGRGLGTALLGQYQAGGQIVATATGDVVGPLVRALFPTFAMTTDVEQLKRKYVQIQALIICLALPIGVGLSAIAHGVVRLVLGSQWDLAVPVVQVLGPVFAIQTMLATVDAVAMATGKTKKLFWRTAIVFCVRVLILSAGFYFGHFFGVIWARVLSGLFYLGYGLRLAANLTGTSVWDPIRNSWRSITSAAAMFASLTGIEMIEPMPLENPARLAIYLSGRVAFGGVVYVLVHAALWQLAGRPLGVERMLLQRLRRQRAGGRSAGRS